MSKITKSTVPMDVLREYMSADTFEKLLESMSEFRCKNMTIQIYLTTYERYINLQDDIDEPSFWEDHPFLKLENFDRLSCLKDYMGESAFESFLNDFHGKNLNIWICDENVTRRKENNKALINDYFAGEKSYAVLAERYGTTVENARQLVCRAKKKTRV